MAFGIPHQADSVPAAAAAACDMVDECVLCRNTVVTNASRINLMDLSTFINAVTNAAAAAAAAACNTCAICPAVTNASRTNLMDLSTLDWHAPFLDLFEAPASIMPRIVSNAEVYGHVVGGPLAGVPISGAACSITRTTFQPCGACLHCTTC
jgi:hypothetical protein